MELDADGTGGSHLVDKLTQGRVRLQRRGVTLCLHAQIRPALVCVAPEQEDAAIKSVHQDVELGAPVLEDSDDLRQEMTASVVDTARPPDPPGLRAWSPVDTMRDRLRLLHGNVYGSGEQCWKRLLECEEAARKEDAVQRELAPELEGCGQGLSEHERVA